MEIRAWTRDDVPMLQEWHAARHDYPLAECLLPPLGFVVEVEGEPIVALFAYQSYGVGVAFIDIALSRPRTPYALAKRAFYLCLQAIILACDETHKFFRVSADAAITRVLVSMGFQKVSSPPLSNLFYLVT